MKRIYSIWIIIAVLLLIAGSSFFMNRATEDTVLAKKIDDQARSGTTEISLTSLTDFDWDKAMVYGPYTSKEIIEDSLDITFKGSTLGIESLEDRFLLVFAKDGYAVKTVKLSRRGIDFSENEGMLTPDEDVLLVN